MKKLIAFMLLLTAASYLKAQQGKETPFLTKSLAKESVQKVEVSTSGGSISVNGVNPSEARVEVYIWGNNDGNGQNISKEEIQKRLNDYYELNISVAANKLTAIAKPKDKNMNWKKGLSISFKVYVPQNVSTHLRTSGGSISLNTITGTQDFATSGGSLTLEKVKGQISGRTSGGSINVYNSSNNIDLETSGGSIDAQNCDGTLTLNTSGGSVKLKQLQGTISATTSGGSIDGNDIKGALEAHTSGGNVDLSGLSCSLDASTSGGNIDVEMKDLSKQVKLTNSGGNIDLQIPKNKGVNLRLTGDKIKIDQLENFSGTKDDDQVEGTLNGGGIPVVVKAGSGRIRFEVK